MAEPLVKDWELYSSSMNRTKANKALNAALKRAAKKLVTEFKRRKLREGDNESIGRLIAELRDKIMLPVMKKYEKFGAMDTEPLHLAGLGLINAAKEYFNVCRSSSRPDWGVWL